MICDTFYVEQDGFAEENGYNISATLKWNNPRKGEEHGKKQL